MTTDGLGFPEHADTVERVERGVARTKPPDDLFDRIVAETRPGEVVPRRRRRLLRTASPVAAAAVASVAAVLTTLSLTGGDGLGDPVLRAALAGSNVRGSAAVYKPDRPDGRLVVDLDSVPEPPSDHFYELWLTRSDGVRISVGSFTPDDGEAHFEVPLPIPGSYASIDISIEQDDGPPEHSGQSLATARLSQD
jgi:hypothetical protein